MDINGLYSDYVSLYLLLEVFLLHKQDGSKCMDTAKNFFANTLCREGFL
jgi:hypothetical protein